MKKHRGNYIPSWARKTPCAPTKRSRKTICNEDRLHSFQDVMGNREEVRKAESEGKITKNVIDLRETPMYSSDDLAVRMLAPFPSESNKYSLLNYIYSWYIIHIAY